MRADVDLPVALALPQPLLDEVAAWVEGDTGWQLVSLDGPPTPALVLSSAPLTDRPFALLVDGVPSADAVRRGLQQGAVDVIGWPDERGRIAAVAASAAPAAARGSGTARTVSCVRVAGTAGGVGTSTVCLAIGGVLAWSGLRVVVAGDDDLLRLCGHAPWEGPGLLEMAALRPADAGGEAGSLARPVDGVDGLAVIGGGGAALASTEGWPVDVVVADMRATATLDDANLVVARPDGALRCAAGTTAPVLLVGAGPADSRGARRLLGHPPHAWLPHSARVARAGLAGRVPSSLPGSWLAALRSALRPIRRRAHAGAR